MSGTSRPRRWDVAMVLICCGITFTALGAIGRTGRRRAKGVVCQANLRQWGAIFRDYVQENDGDFLGGADGTPGYWWIRQLGEEHKNWKRTRIWFCPEADTPIFGEDGSLAFGPSTFLAWGIYNGEGLGENGMAGSYALNGYVIPIERAMYESGVPGDQGWRNLDAIAEAGNVPMFLDALRFDLWPREMDQPPAYESMAWSNQHMARCCINRHDGTVTSLFVDGSVRKVGLKELWTLKWHRAFDTAGPWTRAGGAWPSDWPQWMRDFKEY